MRLFAGQHVSGFLQKPFTSTQLAEKVKVVLLPLESGGSDTPISS